MRIFSLLLCATLLLFGATALFAAGGDEGAAEGVTTITWNMAVDDESGTSWFLEELERVWSVDIVPNGVHHNNQEETNIMIASGELPDAGPIGYQDLRKMVSQGILRTFTRQNIETNMPGYSKMLNTHYPIGWKMHLVEGEDDLYYTLQGVSSGSDAPLFAVAFRSDWAANVGIELPDYDELKISVDDVGKNHVYNRDLTLDWVKDALTKFRDGDPDGNGRDDTIPWAAYYHGGFRWAWAPLAGAYGLSFRDNFMVDGELLMWNIHPNYKEFLIEMADWYEQGLIDKEFITLDRSKGYEKVVKGLVAAASSSYSYSGETRFNDRPPSGFIQDADPNPDAEVVMLKPLVGPFGDQGSVNYRPVTPLGYQDFVINGRVDDAKTELILQIADWMNFDDDAIWIQRYFGKEGVHFDWSGEPMNSTAIRRDAAAIPAGNPKIGAWPTVYPPAYTPERQKYVLAGNYGRFLQEYMLNDWGKSMAIRPYRWDEFGATNLTEVNSEFGATLKTMEEEFFYGAVIGDIDVDAEWDRYVSEWRKNGGDARLAELEKAPLVSELLKGNVVY